MEAKSSISGILVIVAFVLHVALAGCSDATKPDQKEEGTITIEQIPDTLSGASWILTGSQSGSGSGDSTLTRMPVGVYELVWTAVDGYITPTCVDQTLTADDSITFIGTYLKDLDPAESFVPIPAGIFTMGSPSDEPNRQRDEIRHLVTLTRSFTMSSTEVTNQQFAKMAQWAYDNGHCTATTTSLRDNLDGSIQELLNLERSSEISFSMGTFTVDSGKEQHPVVEVTWYGAVAYCDWLSLREGITRSYNHETWQCNGNAPYGASGYRLPTEAEWEYACRVGTQTPFNTGDCLDAGTEANYNGNYAYSDCPSGPYIRRAVPVGSYPANTFGLYDMHGNVGEWCNEWYGVYGGDETDPVGSTTGVYRVIRGGNWFSLAQSCRSAFRNISFPYYANYGIGFRPVRSTF